MAAWEASLREMTKWSVVVENAIDKASERDVPDVLCSALTDDCIARGKTIKEGGAVYDFISGLQVGIANMSDSLAAIKKLVYEEGKISRQELWDALLSDFAGEEGERIRQMLIDDAPKYGNDDDYVDSLAVECYEPYIDEVAKYHNTRFGRGPIGGIRYAGTSSISANVGQGMRTMATDLSPYVVELVVLVTGGGFLAVAMLLTSIMAIMRRQNGLIAGNVIAAVLAALLCPVATEHFGILGAAWSYLATVVLLVISFLVPYAVDRKSVV